MRLPAVSNGRLAHSPPTTATSTTFKEFSRPTSRRPLSMTWSILCSFILLNACLSILSPSTAGGRSHAALTPGFCGDCQTFGNAIAECGGSFTNKDIEEIVGEYVLQQPYSKCLCKSVIQQVLWTCAKCELLAGFNQAKAPPPQKYQTQCIAWGHTIDEWKAPYTGQIAAGTVTDMGGGPNPPAPQPSTPTSNPNPPKPGPSTTGNGGSKPPSSSDPSSPSSTSGNSENPSGTTEANSGPNTTAIGISVGIIGVVGVAGAIVVVMMKKKKRRAMRPIDLADLNVLTDKHARPESPLGPIASAAPAVIRARDPTPQHQNYEEINHGQGYNGQQQYYEQGSDYNGYGQQYDARRYNEYPQESGYPQGQQQYSDEYYDQQYNHYPQSQPHAQYSQPQQNYYEPKASQAPPRF